MPPTNLIDEIKFLGFQLFQRTRISEEVIPLKAEAHDFFYPGLAFLGRTTCFQTQYFNDIKSHEWERWAFESIHLCLYSLLMNGYIEIVYFNDQRFYLGELFQRKDRDYYFRLLRTDLPTDFQSRIMLKTIELIQKKPVKYRSLKKFIQLFIEALFEESQASNAHLGYIYSDLFEKDIILKVFKIYVDKLGWLRFTSKDTGGFIFKKGLDVEDDEYQQIKATSELLFNNAAKTIKSNIAYRVFYETLKDAFKEERTRRDNMSG